MRAKRIKYRGDGSETDDDDGAAAGEGHPIAWSILLEAICFECYEFYVMNIFNCGKNPIRNHEIFPKMCFLFGVFFLKEKLI